MSPNLPDNVKKVRACVNVRNNDDQSFKWAILSAMHPLRNGQRVHPYEKFKKEQNFSGMRFPIDPSQIPRFEEQNDISIETFIMLIDGNILPLHKTSRRKPKHADLLLIQSDTENSFHYVWIKNLHRLLKKFKVLQESFAEKCQEAELKIDLQSVETYNHAFGLHSDDLQHQNLQQLQESNSRSENCSKNVSTQTNSDIPNSVLLRKKKKQESKEPMKNSRTKFDVFSEVLQRSKDSCPNEQNEKNCNHLEIYSNENDNSNELENSFQKNNEGKEFIFKKEKKVKTVQSVETCNHAFGLHSDDLQHQNLQQLQESNSRSENCSKDVSTQTNSDIPNSVILRKKKKQKSKEPMKNSRTKFDVFSEVLQRSKDSCPNEQNEQNCNYLEIESNENDNLNYSSSTDLSDINLYTNLINEKSSKCKKNEIDYANWDNPNQLVDRLRILVAEPAVENYRHTNEIYTIIRELKKAEYIY